jgi:hypothetical protein
MDRTLLFSVVRLYPIGADTVTIEAPGRTRR